MTDITQDMLSDLFETKEMPTFLHVTCMKNDKSIQQSVDIRLSVPRDLHWFAGHFPGTPVLPGIVQINWAGTLAKALFDDLAHFKKMTNVKFKRMIMPETELSLTLSRKWDQQHNTQQIKFSYFDQETVFSTGIFTF